MALSLIELLYKKSRINKNLGIQKYAPNQIGTSGGIVLTNSDIIQFDKNRQSFLDIPKEMPDGFDSNNLEFERKITDETGGIIHNLERPVYQEEINRQIHDRLSKLSVQDRVLYERSLLPECCDCIGPNSPSNLSFQQTSTSSILLSWADNSNNELGFRIYKSIDSGSIWNQIDDVGTNITGTFDFDVVIGNTYWYRVNAYNDCTSSIYSNVYSGTLTDLIISSSASDILSTINTTMVFGNLSSAPPNTDSFGISTTLSSGSLVDIIITTASLDSASVSFAFYSGSIVDVIYYATSSESSSVTFGFYSGSIVDVIYTTSAMDSASVSFAFYSGSIHNVVIIAPLQSEPTTINVGLLSGSLS